MKPLDLINWAWRQNTGNSRQKMLLVYLACRQGDKDSSYAKNKTIMDHLQIKKDNTFYDARNGLIETGLINYNDGVYSVVFPTENIGDHPYSPTPKNGVVTPKNSVVNEVKPTPKNGVNEHRKTVQGTPKNGAGYTEKRGSHIDKQTINRQLTDNEQTIPPISPPQKNLDCSPGKAKLKNSVGQMTNDEFNAFAEQLWKDYPVNKTSKGSKAEFAAKLKTAIQKGADHADIERGLAGYRNYIQQTGAWSKQASRWIVKMGWKDDYSTPSSALAHNGRKSSTELLDEALYGHDPQDGFATDGRNSGVIVYEVEGEKGVKVHG